ncbi:MAG: type IV pili methyl-accepting chemotaxis transducer N-terminal domain-containing protein [Planctomycetales bacterium]|nr:type IV pili methyl-accepting chemotaxis transducer N-terminal domain-containing protein [Planctomycetales bacterium]
MGVPRNITDSPDTGPALLSRRLGQRYGLALVAVAMLVLLDQAVIQPTLMRLNLYAPVINVSGRQRMLSQRLSKAALAMLGADTDQQDAYRRELNSALGQWTTAQLGLLHGDSRLGVPATRSAVVLEEFRQLAPHFEAMRAAAETIADPSSDPGVTKAGVATLLQHESAYLPRMDRIVGLFEQEARTQVAWLRWLGFAVTGAILPLLLAVGWLVVRPATRTIQRQIDELTSSRANLTKARDKLEERVASRTCELQAANDALQREACERQQAEERTRQLSLQLSHASRITAIGQLAAGLAHELNQPLSAIALYAETAELALTPDTQRLDDARQTVERIRGAALRAGNLVRSLRSFVRPGVVEHAPTRMHELVEEVCALCQAAVAESGAELQIDVPSDLPVICVDRIQIQQVLLNLIQNALQAMRNQPTEVRRLHVHGFVEQATLCVEVVDTGPGFGEAHAESVFQPFFTTKTEGLGMGLAICRTIVRQHGGELLARNAPEGGAVVAFVLPLPTEREKSDANELNRVCR